MAVTLQQHQQMQQHSVQQQQMAQQQMAQQQVAQQQVPQIQQQPQPIAVIERPVMSVASMPPPKEEVLEDKGVVGEGPTEEAATVEPMDSSQPLEPAAPNVQETGGE